MMYVIKHSEASNVHWGAKLFGPFDSEDDARVWVERRVRSRDAWEWGRTDDIGSPTFFWGPDGESGTVYEIVEVTSGGLE